MKKQVRENKFGYYVTLESSKTGRTGGYYYIPLVIVLGIILTILLTGCHTPQPTPIKVSQSVKPLNCEAPTHAVMEVLPEAKLFWCVEQTRKDGSQTQLCYWTDGSCEMAGRTDNCKYWTLGCRCKGFGPKECDTHYMGKNQKS